MKNKLSYSKDNNNLIIKNINERYSFLSYANNNSDSLLFEFRYFLFTFFVLLATCIYTHKNNYLNYNFKLIILLILYFFRRTFSKLWYFLRINEKLVYTQYKNIFNLCKFTLCLDILYLFFSIFLNNSFFHLCLLLMVAILQVPGIKLFPSNRYENATQEMVFNAKSKIFIMKIRNFLPFFGVNLLQYMYPYDIFAEK